MKDTLRHQGLRNQLANLLKDKGIEDEKVLAAISRVPRHLFLDSSFEQHAYQDKAFPIAAGQTISQPYTVAFQTQVLEISPKDKVLEIGTGSGYQASVLCEMGAKVYSIERQKELFSFSNTLLKKLGYSLTQKFGDGYKGLPTFAPFDKIVVTAGAPNIPKALLAQLKVGGVMIIPVGNEDEDQEMIKIVRKSETQFTQKKMGAFRFVPMLENKNSK
ncbi:MAG: protein-L-isoaspartate(D-aspartate) O-methyltransferase [Schleiferiaceae bacterium]